MTEKAERRRQHAELVKEKARRDLFIRDTLARQDGREFFWWLLQIGKFGAQPFATDPGLTAFACGELNVGQQIFAAISEADPAGFLRMQQERNDVRPGPTEQQPVSPGSDDGDPTDTPDSSYGPFGNTAE